MTISAWYMDEDTEADQVPYHACSLSLVHFRFVKMLIVKIIFLYYVYTHTRYD
jgi:hypothetical protein